MAAVLGFECKRKNMFVLIASSRWKYCITHMTEKMLYIFKVCNVLNLQQKVPIKIFTENQSSIKTCLIWKSKPIDIKYHSIRYLIFKNIVYDKYHSKIEMTADIMPDQLPKAKFKLRRKLN